MGPTRGPALLAVPAFLLDEPRLPGKLPAGRTFLRESQQAGPFDLNRTKSLAFQKAGQHSAAPLCGWQHQLPSRMC